MRGLRSEREQVQFELFTEEFTLCSESPVESHVPANTGNVLNFLQFKNDSEDEVEARVRRSGVFAL